MTTYKYIYGHIYIHLPIQLQYILLFILRLGVFFEPIKRYATIC